MMVDTSARPTMRAEAVWAVRRGLRIEFSRPSLPEIRKARASGRPITLDIGSGHGRCQHADADEDGDGAETDQLDGRLGQTEGERGDAERRR